MDDTGVFYDRLLSWFSGKETALVAFSGGTDSTLLLHAAVQTLGSASALAAMAVSPSLPSADRERARETAASLGCELVEFETGELHNPLYAENPPDRCYHCRKEMAGHLIKIASERGMKHVLDGSTAEDRGDYRPGSRAMAEAGVRSPLADLGLSKAQIRELSRHAGLSTARVPAGACLASRIPYGEPITREKLARVDRAEASLRELGFELVRVRSHGDLARVEVGEESLDRFGDGELRSRVIHALQNAGFRYVTLDLAGYRQGSLNEVLDLPS